MDFTGPLIHPPKIIETDSAANIMSGLCEASPLNHAFLQQVNLDDVKELINQSQRESPSASNKHVEREPSCADRPAALRRFDCEQARAAPLRHGDSKSLCSAIQLHEPRGPYL